MATSFKGNEVWSLLLGGGLTLTRRRTQEGDFRLSISKYDPLSDPQGAMRMARLLATAAAELGPTVIVAWEDLEDAVLAFAVGVELGIPVIRAFDMEGLIRHSGGFPEEPRAVLVTDALRADDVIEALRNLLRQTGGVLLGVVSLVGLREVTSDLVVKSLVSASDGPIGKDEGVGIEPAENP